MALYWTLARFLFRTVAPTVPDLVAAASNLKKQKLREEVEREHSDAKVSELERIVTAQVQAVEQTTRRLEALQNSVAVALWLSVGGLVISLIVLGLLLAG